LPNDETNEQVSVVEFKHLELMHFRENDSEMIREAFRVFDRDGNGYITADEFRYFMTHVSIYKNRCEFLLQPNMIKI
jgi:calmodulin